MEGMKVIGKEMAWALANVIIDFPLDPRYHYDSIIGYVRLRTIFLRLSLLRPGGYHGQEPLSRGRMGSHLCHLLLTSEVCR